MLGTVDSVLKFSLFYESKKEEQIKYLYSYSFGFVHIYDNINFTNCSHARNFMLCTVFLHL